jgi:hypothetical protein
MTSAVPTLSLARRLSSSSDYICYVRIWWWCIVSFTCHSTGISRVYILHFRDLYFTRRRSTPTPLLSIATPRALFDRQCLSL